MPEGKLPGQYPARLRLCRPTSGPGCMQHLDGEDKSVQKAIPFPSCELIRFADGALHRCYLLLALAGLRSRKLTYGMVELSIKFLASFSKTHPCFVPFAVQIFLTHDQEMVPCFRAV